MAIALVDAATWIGGVDYTGQSNKVMLGGKAEGLDVSTFGSGGYRTRIGGLRTVEAAIDGFWSSAVDADAVGNIGAAGRVVTIAPTGVEGDVAYLFRAGTFDYEAGDQVGVAFPFSIDLQGTDPIGLVRGVVAASPRAVNSIGAIGAPVILPAASSSQFIYATLHVYTAGTTVTVDIESDVDDTFASPATVATFGPITAVGGTWMTRVAGPRTDTHYRFKVTAITGTFTVAGAIAVQ